MEDWFAKGAAAYDESEGFMFEAATIERTVDVLEQLVGGGRALELAIGTGRIGLPLARRGVEVHGIELSGPMVDQLRAKPGGGEIPVTIGDMTSARADGAFRLVYLVFNTIENLTTQEAQIACFENAARQLEPGGVFLVTARGKSSMPFRYVWPAELDLMARIAGLRLRDRFEDWDRSPFTNESPKHVSSWEKAS